MDALGTKKGVAQYELYKDTSGEIYVTGKGGTGKPYPRA
jgi:hypothetical protein